MESSLLNRLPPEVRNIIYKAALAEFNRHGIRNLSKGVPPLLRTCKQIRQESRLMYFGCNGFYILVDEEHARAITDWIKSYDSTALKAMKYIALACEEVWSNPQSQESPRTCFSRLHGVLLGKGVRNQRIWRLTSRRAHLE